jgi:hypothetical protein
MNSVCLSNSKAVEGNNPSLLTGDCASTPGYSMRNPRLNVLLVLIVLAASSLACTLNLGGPKTPTQVPVQATEDSQPLDQVLSTSVPVTVGSEFEIKITESQLTDYLKEELAKQNEPVLQDPSVILRDGLIEIYGTAKTGFLTGNLRLVTEVTIDDQGNPQIKITSADIGGMPLPSGLLGIFSGMIESGLTSNLGSFATGFRLQEIHIADGVMVVRGEKR